MKKLILCLTAAATALVANAPAIENPDTELPSDLSFPVYAPINTPLREQTEKTETSMAKKAAAVVIGTLAAVTIGLLVSGANTGKHAPHGEDSGPSDKKSLTVFENFYCA